MLTDFNDIWWECIWLYLQQNHICNMWCLCSFSIATSSFKMRLNIFPFQRCYNWNIANHAGFVIAVKLFFYQILQFFIKLLAWQVFANIMATRRGILLFNSRGTWARCLGSRRRLDVNISFTDDDRILIENLYI